ncbi:MAG: DUF1015 domain-containing protein [bacterium]|nr:DUF1015 domain-containing protein [bacterium]
MTTKIVPFRAVHYNLNKIGDLSKVVTQPYDKIGPELREEYLKRSPYNIARVIKPVDDPTLPPDNGYETAGQLFKQWYNEGILIRRERPALYAYDQEYIVDGKTYVRHGFVGLLDLEKGKDLVKAHEQTLAGPKADRLKLMRADEANEGHIFMLYSDPSLSISNLLEMGRKEQPILETKDDFSCIHRVWEISDPSLIQGITQGLEDKLLFIADGHHRFETALTYMNECKQKGWKPIGVETFTHRMMTFINLDEPGLTILPTHRLIRDVNGFDASGLLEKSKQWFSVTPISTRTELFERMKQKGHHFGVSLQGKDGYFLLSLLDENIMDELGPKDKSRVWKLLDVSILHTLLLDKLLGIDEKKLEAQTNVDYGRDPNAALDKREQGKYQAVFLLNPTSAHEVRAVAEQGEKMPQKSTDFFPKLLSGLIMMKMEIGK